MPNFTIVPSKTNFAVHTDKENMLHLHPRDVTKTIFGRRLEPGEQLRRTDVYDAAVGKWQPVQDMDMLAGEAIPEAARTIYIRPAR